MAGEAAAGVAAGEVLVGAAGAVEVAARGHVEDAAPHREVDGRAVEPVVGQQGPRRVRLEDGGGRLARQLGRRARLEEQVGGIGRQDHEDQVEGGREAGAAVAILVTNFRTGRGRRWGGGGGGRDTGRGGERRWNVLCSRVADGLMMG